MNRFCGEFRYYVNEDEQKLKTRTFAGNLFRMEADVRRALKLNFLNSTATSTTVNLSL